MENIIKEIGRRFMIIINVIRVQFEDVDCNENFSEKWEKTTMKVLLATIIGLFTIALTPVLIFMGVITGISNCIKE